MWYQIFEQATGRLISETDRPEDVAALPAELGYVESATRPNPSMWDETLKAPKVLPVAILTTFDPLVSPIVPTKQFGINQEIGIRVVVVGEDENPVVGLTGAFSIPILRYDSVMPDTAETVKRLRIDLVDGIGQRTFTGFVGSGDYGVDQRCSDQVRILEPYVIQVSE